MQDIGEITKPYKVGVGIEWRHDGEDAPYKTTQSEQWFEADGTQITDPARIAELDAQIVRREECP